MMVCDVTTSTVLELNKALSTTGPGTARHPDATVTYGMVAVVKVTISPLLMVHPLLRSPFLTPVNALNLVAARAAYLGLEYIVTPLLRWIRDHTSSQAKEIGALGSVDLSKLMIRVRQDLKYRLTPPTPRPNPHPSTVTNSYTASNSSASTIQWCQGKVGRQHAQPLQDVQCHCGR